MHGRSAKYYVRSNHASSVPMGTAENALCPAEPFITMRGKLVARCGAGSSALAGPPQTPPGFPRRRARPARARTEPGPAAYRRQNIRTACVEPLQSSKAFSGSQAGKRAAHGRPRSTSESHRRAPSRFFEGSDAFVREIFCIIRVIALVVCREKGDFFECRSRQSDSGSRCCNVSDFQKGSSS